MKYKILVVDDEQAVADTLCLIFKKRGFDCRAVYTGAAAVACTDEYCPELLLCDISMPGMSGLEVVSQVTVKCPDCRVLNRTLHQPGIRPRVGALSFRTQPHHDKARTSRVTPGSRGCPASISAPVSLAANERGSGLH